MIRPAVPADTPALVRLAEESGFTAEEAEDVRARLDAVPVRRTSDGHQALTAERDGAVAGVIYYAPVAMTEGTWGVYWLVFGPAPAGEAVGADLLRHAEDDARRRGGRLLVAETSSEPAQEPARRAYAAAGYEPGAVLHDFYADGEDQIIFRKRLIP
jgi:ribosomal protein S18 acetylase RimI-like enzyme